ncbi:MAG: PocR ligand-binding domain-containing protein [Candidatus Omnitrophica bacterium]|nr:PocR ligand-binding domain-containing protein [Candidatus Omnitrophota bacterium]
MEGNNKEYPGKREPSLRELIDVKTWQKIQDKFSAVIGAGLRLVDAEGKLVTTPSGEPRLCAELLKNPITKNMACGQNCLPSFLGGSAVVDKNLGFVCNAAGLHNFITPLRIGNGKVLGYFIIGPVLLVMPKSKEDCRKAAEELGIDAADLWSALLEIKVISFRGAQSLVELIKDVEEFCLKAAYQKTIREMETTMAIAADSTKLTKLLNALLDVAFEISGADIGSVMLFDKASDELTIRVYRGIADEIARKTRVKLGNGISGIAARDGESFLINKNTEDNRIKPYLNRPYINSSMVVPLKMESTVLGVMNLGTLETSSVSFDSSNMGVVRKLVDLATVAINP